LHRNDFDRRSRDYSGVNYNERRFGGDVYMRKRLFELWEGKLSYSLEDVKIYDLGVAAPEIFKRDAGNTKISKLTFSMERDSRDDLFYPTSGSKLDLDLDLAGGPFLGDAKYFKIGLTGVKHWKVFDTAQQVFSIIGRTGTIMPYGGKHTPFFERFQMGGANFMKGFKAHTIGPMENDTGVGGNTFAYLSAEYCFRIIDPLRLYLFGEVGFINDKKWDFSTRHYNTDIGFGLKISIFGMPLRLDFGFPMHGEGGNKHGMRFNYSFGVAF
jgi:outer membrane protein insertion porin family